MTNSSFSVIMPSFNEEANLAGAVESLRRVLDKRFSSYELLIIDDGSTDSTGEIADRLAARNPSIKVIHHPQNKGLGHTLREGYSLATQEYVFWFGGANTFKAESLADLFGHLGEVDMVIPYFTNLHVRPLFRRIVSRSFTALMNLLFGLKLRYYNGAVIYRTEWVKPVSNSANSNGHFLVAEILIRCLKSGHTFIEVPAEHQRQPGGSSKAFYPKNVLSVLTSIWRLWWETRGSWIRKSSPNLYPSPR